MSPVLANNTGMSIRKNPYRDLLSQNGNGQFLLWLDLYVDGK